MKKKNTKTKSTQPAASVESGVSVKSKRTLRNTWVGRQHQSLWVHIRQSVLYSPRYGRTLLAMAVFLMVMKMLLVHEAYGAALVGTTTVQTMINYISVIASDFMIVGLVFIGAFLNAVIRRRWFKRYVNVTALLLMLLYVSDMFSIYYFQSRFYLMDLLQFFSFRNGANYVLYPLAWAIIFVTILFVFFLLVQKRFPMIRRKNMHLRAALVFFGICVLFSVVNLLSNTDFHFRNNVLAINIQEMTAVANAEDADMLPGRDLQTYDSYFTQMVGQKRKGDVIIVFAESFSTVDSKRSGGQHDFLTGFDLIASKGVTYTNFISNGCTSEISHIALLQGVEPWEVLQGSAENYKNYKAYTPPLPEFFNGLGYKTTFLSTVPLTFLHQREFLDRMAFQEIIGEEAFTTGQKYVFNAAPDKVLFDKALDIVRTKDPKKPLFLGMQTISTHKPYNSPAGTSERASMTYADLELQKFYEALEKDGFFKEGTLIVVGDHRKMEPLEREEFQKYGASANGRAVMAVVGPGIKPDTYSDDLIQHLDIFSSLKYLYGSGQIQLSTRFNDMLGNYEGRKQAIRYCQYVERQYIATDKDGDSWTISASTDKQNLGYINAYKDFQQYTGSLMKDMQEIENLKKNKGLVIIGHQGAPMIEAPNSYSSFMRAKDQGADAIEFDLSLTKDKYQVVIHGPDIGRTQCKNSEGKKNVAEFTLKELKDNCKLFNGEPVLTFTEALQKTHGHFKYTFVEIKVDKTGDAQHQVDEVLEVIDELDREKDVIVSSYDPLVNQLLNEEGKKFTIARDTFASADYTKVNTSNHKFFMLPHTSYEKFIVDAVRGYKKELVTYTVNNVQDLERVYNMGIRYIMTDNVPMIIEWLKDTQNQAK